MHRGIQWNWAPDDEVVLSFYKEGYAELRNLTISALDEMEYVITLSKQAAVRR